MQTLLLAMTRLKCCLTAKNDATSADILHTLGDFYFTSQLQTFTATDTFRNIQAISRLNLSKYVTGFNHFLRRRFAHYIKQQKALTREVKYTDTNEDIDFNIGNNPSEMQRSTTKLECAKDKI